MLEASKLSPYTNEMSDAEHTVLPALLLLAEPNESRQESAAITPNHLPDINCSFFLFLLIFFFFLSVCLSVFLRSLDDELPHARRSRSPTRYYDPARGRHQEEYLDDRCVSACVRTTRNTSS